MNVQVREFAAASGVQQVLHRDYETRGVLQLQKAGLWKYAADDRTEVLCCAFCVDDGPVKLWLPGDPVPAEFLEAAHDPALLACAHNAQFELTIEHLIMRRRHGWPKISLWQQRCAMAAALALALPPKLELVAKALELLHQKDRAGQRLMFMMSKPRRPRKDGDPEGLYWLDDEDRRQRFYEYCREDVEIERELISLGYRRNLGPGSWLVRCADGKGGAWTQGFSTADDFEDSDNEHVLDFWS